MKYLRENFFFRNNGRNITSNGRNGVRFQFLKGMIAHLFTVFKKKNKVKCFSKLLKIHNLQFFCGRNL